MEYEGHENQKIIEVDINHEMKDSFLAYSMSVIVQRALPDVRDGLKPVHRRILYTVIILTAMLPCMTLWCVWHRISPCDTCWWTDTATSVLWTATRLPLTVIPKPR